MRYAPLALAVCIMLSACTPTVWNKPGATQAQVSQDKAKCRLVSRGVNSGGSYAEDAHGSATGAAVGNAFGSAVNTAATYEDCMLAIGYTPQKPYKAAAVAAASEAASEAAFAKPASENEKFKPIFEKMSACVAKVYASPAAKPLLMHSSLSVDQLSPEQLSDPAFASNAVVASIAAVHPGLHQCQQAALKELRDTQPALVPVITSTFAQTERALDRFKARRITWGAYNTERRSIAQALRTQLVAALRQ